jgi:acyl carrier protein
MGHWILNNETAHVASSKSKVSLKDQLAAARNREQVFSLVRGAILGKLFALLRLETDIGNFYDGTCLDELGVDSLITTELRSFLMKVFNVNVPVLRTMGGISFKELAGTVVNVLDPSMIPNARQSQLQTLRRFQAI